MKETARTEPLKEELRQHLSNCQECLLLYKKAVEGIAYIASQSDELRDLSYQQIYNQRDILNLLV